MINWEEWELVVREAAMQALSQGGLLVANLAREKAPIRKIFAGGRRTFRQKSMKEAEHDRKMLLGLGPEFAAPPRSTLRHARSRFMRVVTKGDTQNTPFSAPKRKLAGPGHLQMAGIEERLSRRGRSELKTMRASYGGFLGGRLRAEIHAVPAVVEGSHIRVSVISPTPYAKYQEFGTRHNPAHPFLRPAAEESRAQVVATVAEAIARAAAGGLGSLETGTITVHLKATGA